MSERNWNIIIWLGILGATGGIAATLASYFGLRDSGIAIASFIVAIVFAVVAAVANIGAGRVRQVRWQDEMNTAQRRVDDYITTAAATAVPPGHAPASPEARAEAAATEGGYSSKHLGPQARALADEGVDAAGELEEGRERPERGNWE